MTKVGTENGMKQEECEYALSFKEKEAIRKLSGLLIPPQAQGARLPLLAYSRALSESHRGRVTPLGQRGTANPVGLESRTSNQRVILQP